MGSPGGHSLPNWICCSYGSGNVSESITSALLSCETYSYIWEISTKHTPAQYMYLCVLFWIIVSFYLIYGKISRISTSKTYYKHLSPEKNSDNRWLHCQKSFPQKTPVILLSTTLHNCLEITPEKPIYSIQCRPNTQSKDYNNVFLHSSRFENKVYNQRTWLIFSARVRQNIYISSYLAVLMKSAYGTTIVLWMLASHL